MIPKKLNWNLDPFLHVQVLNYIPESEGLLKEISEEEFISKKSDLFSLFQTNSLVERDYLREVLAKIKSDVELSVGKTFSSIDCHATVYSDCDFLLPHDDQLEGRKYAYLLYLSDVSEDEGGALALFDSKCLEVIKRIQPHAFSLVVFEVSEISFHAVEEVLGDIQRIAIGGWLHD